MEHSIATAIRFATAKICRRLDVLIEAMGHSPVQDIEGTSAPRKPLHPSAVAKTPTSSKPHKKRGRPHKKEATSEAHSTSSNAPKKRGRPHKKEATSEAHLTMVEVATASINTDTIGTNAEVQSQNNICVHYLLMYFRLYTAKSMNFFP